MPSARFGDQMTYAITVATEKIPPQDFPPENYVQGWKDQPGSKANLISYLLGFY